LQAPQLVDSTDRTRLAVYSAGRADAPLVLLVHGWAQSARCWHHQLDDPGELRVAAFDLRGHGGSDAPAHGYDDPRAWADDLHSVLRALGGGPAVLVGWSYGGLVIADYLGRYGGAATAGVLLTGAITGLGRGVPGGRIGPVMRAALPGALSEDPEVAVPALTAFVHGMTAEPLPDTELRGLLEASTATPARVRAALFDRTADATGCVSAAGVRVLVQHGTADPVVDRSTAEHLPFVEDPPRFDRTLRAFARCCTTDRERMAR